MSSNEHTNTFLKLKLDIASSYGPDFRARITKAWAEIIDELGKVSERVSVKGPEYIPQVKFSELASLPPERADEIRRIGTVVIRDVVDDKDARGWQDSLKEFVKTNPDVPGFPAKDKQFFELYWTKPQVEARSHPNVLAASAWLNNLYRDSSPSPMEGVDLSAPLTYADRFRIRHPGGGWTAFSPHIDGGSIERWQDPAFRSCFDDILTGDWQKHDPFALRGRLEARSSLYDRANQASVFRTFQGWLAMSETAPTEGTLKVFPDLLLSNAYIILRPFFRPLVPVNSPGILDSKNWEYDISYADFPGIFALDKGFGGPRPTPESHPHLMLEQTMTSVPKVMPGDTVFWHCDVVHSVEVDHTGQEDSAVMYIPAVPTTPINKAYVEKQKETFLKSTSPPDYPKCSQAFAGIAREVGDLLSPQGVLAMGLTAGS
ncbi:hypothetical protein GYMLUDRAFT_98191 [Collybiopsis luxurians FD-317 M1]|uniref:DUF1479-domain-containing protein n=1 Tax=Collybiopsis luxurians FD-317 M1 TaxID=944289 RepID=A0A0D0BSC2_9AGAR|nr:hypothetical protein GYMLUDRAFT_98191 [Collybiopsis luxurians FD-317 M1]